METQSFVNKQWLATSSCILIVDSAVDFIYIKVLIYVKFVDEVEMTINLSNSLWLKKRVLNSVLFVFDHSSLSDCTLWHMKAV